VNVDFDSVESGIKALCGRLTTGKVEIEWYDDDLNICYLIAEKHSMEDLADALSL
jgi:hypothetical protein